MNSNYNDSDNSVSGKNTIDSRLMATLWGLEVGMWNSFGYVAQAVGLETTLASKSAFLCSMAVVIVPLLDWIAGKKTLITSMDRSYDGIGGSWVSRIRWWWEWK